jgi:predicted metal-binding membrane protein
MSDISAPAARVDRPAWRTGSTITLLALAALAWAGSVAYARHLGNGPGTMGMALGAFLAMWAAMMTAMMAPAVAPVATAYARTIPSNRAARLALFVAGYLLVWAAVGIPVYGTLRIVDHLVTDSHVTTRNIAAVVLVVAGAYQLSPLKARSLGRCRSELAQLSGDDNITGSPARDLTRGLHYGLSCLACSWALMALLIAFGVMSVWAMVALAAVVVGERVLPRGQVVGQWAGAACLPLALLVLSSPSTANAVVPRTSSNSNMTMPGS